MPASTMLEARYLLRDKLDALLRKEFGSDFKVKVRYQWRRLCFGWLMTCFLQVAGDQIEVTAARKLTQARLSRLPLIAVHYC